MSKSYLVHMIDGFAYVRSSNKSEHLNSAVEAFELADAIISSALLMLEENKDMGTLKKEYIASKLSYILKTSKWGKEEPDRIVDMVYFMVAKEYPSLIKIGKTKDVSRRSKEVSAEHFETETEILHILFCKKALEVEYMLHLHLDEHRVFGEWFNKEAVLKFIEPYIAMNEGKIA